MKRITPNHITSLAPGEIFVFGSNLAGRHGAGAARQALGWGAIYGQAGGLQGSTYAIPTKGSNLVSLQIETIGLCVDAFVGFAKRRPDLKFLVTEIGCGLAGYEPKDIAPLFVDAAVVQNVYLPERFWDVILKKGYVGSGYVEFRKQNGLDSNLTRKNLSKPENK